MLHSRIFCVPVYPTPTGATIAASNDSIRGPSIVLRIISGYAMASFTAQQGEIPTTTLYTIRRVKMGSVARVATLSLPSQRQIPPPFQILRVNRMDSDTGTNQGVFLTQTHSNNIVGDNNLVDSVFRAFAV